MAAEINSQLEKALLSTLGFEPITIGELRKRLLDRHENVRRSSLSTIKRDRTATEYLIRFLESGCPVRRVSEFRPSHAEQFVRYLRTLRVSPNGHQNSRKRPLRDAGVKYILETCSTMFHYAVKNRHLPPYTDNPFQVIEVGRIPIENADPIIIFDEVQERLFLDACDAWQFPLFLTLFMTGMRPGEICHLLLPDDLDLKENWIYVRNKPKLGWQVKTRTERAIPITWELAAVLSQLLAGRATGPIFIQRRCYEDHKPLLITKTVKQLELECQKRLDSTEDQFRQSAARLSQTIWHDLSSLTGDKIRIEFNKLTQKMGCPK